MKKTTRYTDEFISLPAEERPDFLTRHTDESKKAILTDFVFHKDFLVSDLVALPEPFRTWGTQFALGADDGPKLTRQFFLMPNRDWLAENPRHFKDLSPEVIDRMRASVSIEVGRRGGKVFKETLEGPKGYSFETALSFLLQYGPETENDLNRNRVVELTEDQFYEVRSSQQQASKSGKNK